MKYYRINTSSNPLGLAYINDSKKLIILDFNASNSLNLFFINDEYNAFEDYFYNFIELFKTGYRLVIDCTTPSTGEISQLFDEIQIDKLEWIVTFSKKNNISTDFIKIWVSTLPLNLNILENSNSMNDELYRKYDLVMNKIKLFENKNYNMNSSPYDAHPYNKTRKFDNKLILLFENTWSSYNMYSTYISAETLFGNDMISNFNVGNTLIRSDSKSILDKSLYSSKKINNLLNIHKLHNYQNEIKSSFLNLSTTQYLGDFEFDDMATYTIPNDIFYSINNYQPFILLGKQYHLKKLKELGFKTFDKWWDESYDTMEYVIDRTASVVSVLNSISKKSYNELETIYNEMSEVLIHNYNLSKQYKLEYDEYYNNSRKVLLDFNEYDSYLS